MWSDKCVGGCKRVKMESSLKTLQKQKADFNFQKPMKIRVQLADILQV